MSVKNIAKKVEPFDQPSSFMLKTVDLLKQRDLLEVYAETKINWYWLKKFIKLEIPNPSVNRVQYLYEYLSNTNLMH